MEFIDVRHSCECHNCGKNLFKYIWNQQNIISTSDRYDYYDVDGFKLYRNAYYKCPNCGQKFYVRVRNNDEIFS